MSNIFQRISIPKPCHEDWNKMTPDEKGAFCKVCNKSVHDFSRKSPEEVEAILMKEEEGKVCGRFSSEQLPIPQDLEIPLYLLPRNISPFRAFALAVFIVFGTALFGITDARGQGLTGKVCIKPPVKDTARTIQLPTLGGVKYRTPDTTETTKTKPAAPKRVNEPGLEDEKISMKGEVAYRPHRQETVKTTIVGDTVIRKSDPVPNHQPLENPELQLMGDVSVAPPDTSKNKIEPIGEEDDVKAVIQVTDLVMSVPSLDSVSFYTVGMMVVEQDSNLVPTVMQVDPEQDKVVERPSSVIDSLEKSAILEEKQSPLADGPKPEVTCFPNPTSGPATLKYNLTDRSDVQAEVYDMNGNRVMVLFTVRNQYEGNYNVGIDLSTLPSGQYLVRLITGNKVMSTRVIVGR